MERLDAILTEAEMKAEDLELNGSEQRILGAFSMPLQGRQEPLTATGWRT